jgi:hypothetical protein
MTLPAPFRNALTGALMAMALSCNSPQRADLLVINARVYTADPAFSKAEALAVKDGRIVAVGTSESLAGQFEATQVFDAQGYTIVPGLYDGHAHFLGLGETLANADLVGARSWNDVLRRLEAFSAAHPRQPWLTGRGWDQNDWEDKSFPTNDALNAIFPDRPVFLTRVDGHAAIANDQALALAGINRGTEVAGGRIERRPDGKPTGLLIDKAMDLVQAAMPAVEGEALEQRLLAAQDTCLAYGLTTVVDAGLRREAIEAIDRLQQEGRLKIRIYAMVDPADKGYYLHRGPYKTDRLNVRSFKLYADGALGSRGAALLQPYADAPEHRGLLLETPEWLASFMAEAHAKGFQVNTHCIGDSANRLVLDLYGKILGEGNGYRWRIEHAQVVHPDDRPKFARYGVIPSVQPTHATSDMYWAGERLGPDRVPHAYAFRSLMEGQGMVVFGTDFPVEAVSPFYTFHAAVARQDAAGYPEGGFLPGEAVGRKEALLAMTRWAAFSCFEEMERGSLEVGKMADFTLLDRDLMEAPAAELRQAKVLATYIAGEAVYRAPQ